MFFYGILSTYLPLPYLLVGAVYVVMFVYGFLFRGEEDTVNEKQTDFSYFKFDNDKHLEDCCFFEDYSPHSAVLNPLVTFKDYLFILGKSVPFHERVTISSVACNSFSRPPPCLV